MVSRSCSLSCNLDIMLSPSDGDDNSSSFPGFVDGDQENHEMNFPLQSEECIQHYLQREVDHMPMGDYAELLLKGELDASIRRDAINWIWMVHASFKLGPSSAFLSVNYLDRFLSLYKIPEGNPSAIQLISVACVSLASKLEETRVSPLWNFQQVGNAKFVFEPKSVQRMELVVLTGLKFRMQAVTPFSFMDYFLHKFGDGNGPEKFIWESADLILTMIRGIDFLKFKPSELAAAATLTLLEKFQSIEIENAVATCVYLKKERVLDCYQMIQNKTRMCFNATKTSGMLDSFVPESPTVALEVPCLSYTTKDTVFTDPTGDSISPMSKRRRISR